MEKKFGRLPYYKGEWTTGTVAMHKWRYTYMGSELQSTIDNNVLPPLNASGNVNTGWKMISQGINILQEVVPDVTDSVPSSAAIYRSVNAVASGAETEITSSPSVVYRGENQTFTLTGVMKKGTPTQMQLLDGATVIQSGTTSPITKAVTANINAGYKTYGVKGVYMGLEFPDSVDVQARYPIFYGFGSVPTDVAIAANRYAATLSAVHTYQRTSTQNGKNFFILVPSDISGLSTFVMNGAPFVMQPETTTQITVNGVNVTYKVYKSAVAYNSGVLIKVAAS